MVCDTVINMRKYTTDRRGTHHVLAPMVFRHSVQIFILARGVVRCDAFFVNLRICWKSVEKGEKFGVKFYYFGSLIDSWLLGNDIQIISEIWNNIHALPIILYGFNNIGVDIHRLTISLVVQIIVISFMIFI